ncbi:MAG: arsenite S-adenosylmethyltransferase [Bacteroidetes bacterium GWF2_42_66]|nr:MAG: arsenite S-adenosylmethyltransferase [Bacteroidetes bacterium GWA2_42_15]OFY01176.1 MAG: arsenite S-adenosylmethyltransferase [Bacteroidetes bacterium GWE2_42_39]OFY42019.1 MAG: arsenite S-adenosylmethyltransferase [Bacteroidetes bacterium GWF2_42_66]HBL77780.1 arsenite S-adenosylmethyltransferase [Prolixibacteraceae bacterium]HCR89494.1 arsenite S-adenosylmethyltransferase [Prolixibacteraceae bacterium]
MKNSDQIRNAIRERYSGFAEGKSSLLSCCQPNEGGASCCGGKEFSFDEISLKVGYSKKEINSVPEGANMGLGCGNPQAIASLKEGETVLDLGCGGGFDIFLAASQVGKTGKAIGVDMTPKMVSLARSNAEKGGFENTDFRLGEIEYLPVADNTVDVIISNCVINLSPEKQKVFNESFRVLKPGGRLAISDVVALQQFPEAIKNDLELYGGCISGASPVDEVENMLKNAGFSEIRITLKEESKKFIKEWTSVTNITDYISSAIIEAVKPKTEK